MGPRRGQAEIPPLISVHAWSSQSLLCQPPSGLTQKVEEGPELLVSAEMGRLIALTLMAPAPQLHLGASSSDCGRILGIAHLLGGWGWVGWGGTGRPVKKKAPGLSIYPISPAHVRGISVAGLTDNLQKVEGWAWRNGGGGGGGEETRKAAEFLGATAPSCLLLAPQTRPESNNSSNERL